ncbi:tRNA methyltransferase TRMD/TRM10-type domain, partial [Trinorchestia longiramus]
KESLTLSKRQLKKLAKKEKWLATKEERKQREKEKLKQKRIAKREAGEDLGPSRKFLKLSTMATSLCTQRIALDMDFEEFMNERDQCKAVKQLHRCYSCNRRASNPVQLYVMSLKGSCLKIMEKNNGYQKWDVHFCSDSYLDIFSKNDIVYLSSESENVVKELDESKVYIIGGLVDHNNHKGLCHRLAVEKGVAHARLPIDEFMQMKTRKVLTIDHVFQILLAVTEGKTWKEAFLTIIPARKGATAID